MSGEVVAIKVQVPCVICRKTWTAEVLPRLHPAPEVVLVCHDCWEAACPECNNLAESKRIVVYTKVHAMSCMDPLCGCKNPGEPR